RLRRARPRVHAARRALRRIPGHRRYLPRRRDRGRARRGRARRLAVCCAPEHAHLGFPHPLTPELPPNERFRQRRQAARRRKYRIRRTIALVARLLLAALIALGATVVAGHGSSGDKGSAETTKAAKPEKKAVQRTPVPKEVRGVHVTMAL